MNRRATLLQCVCLCLVTASGLIGQEFRASIVGRVTDPSGAAIPGAQVTATHIETNVVARAKTAESGDYILPFLGPGRYNLEIQSPNFSKFISENLTLRILDRVRIDAVLELTTVSEKIQVVSETPILETSSASVGEVITGETIVNMPLFGRNAFALASLANGVLPTARGTAGAWQLRLTGTTQVSGLVAIDGGVRGSNEIVLDGVPMTTGSNEVTFIPAVDSIQEFKVQTGAFDAEFGHFSGGLINTTTKSGTNSFHGALLEFHKNSSMNARDYFAPSKPVSAENQYGGSAGAPVYIPGIYNGKNRTFFFVNFEGNRRGLPRSFVGTVPTALQKSGNFSETQTRLPGGQPAAITIYDPATTRESAGRFTRDAFPGNVIPASRFDPVARNILSLYPAPNSPGDVVTGANNYRSSFKDPALDDGYIVKFDHNFSERFQVFVRQSWRHFYVSRKRIFENEATADSDDRYYPGVAADATYTLNPTSVLNIRYGLNRYPIQQRADSLNFDFARLGFPQSLASALQVQALPSISIAGVTAIGNVAKQGTTAHEIHSLRGSVLKHAGPHALRLGGEFRIYRQNARTLGAGSAGTYTFNTILTRGPNPQAASVVAGTGLASFLLGAGASGSAPITDSSAGQKSYQAVYFQDDLRVSARLSLNVGLRYEFEGPYTERFNRMNRGFDGTVSSPIEAQAKSAYARNPLPEIPADRFRVLGGLRFAGVDGQPRGLTDVDRNNVSPRFGAAFTLTPKTVLRAGIGLFYGSSSLGGPDYGYSTSTPWLSTIDGGLTPYRVLSNPFPDGIASPLGSSGGLMTQIGQSIAFPTLGGAQSFTRQMQGSIQRQAPGGVLLEALYSGTRAYDRDVTAALSATPEIYRAEARNIYLATGRNTLSDRVPNPFFGLITQGTLSTATIARSQLLSPYPHVTSLTESGLPLGASFYHSFQFKASKRLSRGFSLLLGYTIAKLLVQSRYLNPTDTALAKELADYDVPQRLVVSGTYALPFGAGPRQNGPERWLNPLLRDWQINWSYSAQSGIPLRIANGESLGRSAYLPSDQRSLTRWFDTGAFRQRETLELVATDRLPDVRSHGRNNIDLSLFRQLRIGEQVRLQLRAESFNTFNRVEFDVPNITLTSAAFGMVTAQNNLGRQVQVAVKLLW